jgi:predicted nucleic acid-binding protein
MTAVKEPVSLVVDASVLAQVASDEVKLVVPSLARYEILNALSRCVRGLKPGPKLARSDAEEILAALGSLPLEEHNLHGLEGRILEITEQHGCSAYDAAYLALAERWETRFVTGDSKLCAALRREFPHLVFLGDLTETKL